MKYHVLVTYPWSGQLLATFEIENGKGRLSPPVDNPYFGDHGHSPTRVHYVDSVSLGKNKPYGFIAKEGDNLIANIANKDYVYISKEVKTPLGVGRATITLRAFEGEK